MEARSDADNPVGDSPASRWRRVAFSLALLLGSGVVAAVVLNSGSSSPPTTSRVSATAAATVHRRDLVEHDTESGTVSYSRAQTVYNRLSGTVTWLPNVGAVVKPGQKLYKVNGEPVLLMDGGTPAYRTLSASDGPGEDVLELNRNLVRLGFNSDGITVDDTWQAGTTLGIEQLQDSLGELGTGRLPLGQIVFLPGDQMISTVDGTLGVSGGGSGSAPSPAQDTNARVLPLAPKFVSLQSVTVSSGDSTAATSTTTVGSTQTGSSGTPSMWPPHAAPKGKTRAKNKKKHDQTLEALIALLKAEIAALKAEHGAGTPSRTFSPGSSASGDKGDGSAKTGTADKSVAGDKNASEGAGGGGGGTGSGGGGGANGTAILQTTSTHLVVIVDLAASSQSEAVVGERVGVELPAGNTVQGTITAVSPVAEGSGVPGGDGASGGGSGGSGGSGSGGSGGSSSTIPVTITLRGQHGGARLDQAAVSVKFAEARATHVLAVPVTALLATGGSNYAVQEAAAPHKLIPVTTGLFAAGFVQIRGPGIYSGLQVTDSQG